MKRRYKIGDFETIPFRNSRELRKEEEGREIKNLYEVKNIEEVLGWLNLILIRALELIRS
jgi:hypothetical protein